MKKAKYIYSAVSKEGLIKDEKKQFAFVGRSNVGKSSLINALTKIKRLAKTSLTPGLTKMVNYFLIDDKYYFVDLPGYGFAKTAKKNKNIWADVVENYFINNELLLLVFVLLDIRHLPSNEDKQMLDYLVFNDIPFNILATKADKIAKSKIKQYVEILAKNLNIRKEMIKVVSSENGYGISELEKYIESKIEVTKSVEIKN